MTRIHLSRIANTGALLFAGLMFSSTVIWAQSTKLEGIIKARNGDTMILQTQDSQSIPVLLTDQTKVGQVQGVFQARRKEMSMTSLIPGLVVKVEGGYNEKRQLVAASVSFKGKDLERAESIQAGLHETQVQAQANTAELEKHTAELQKQNAELKVQNEALQQHQKEIDAAVARFGQLDDYYILDKLTIYFGNGKTNVEAQYNPQLLALAEKAKGINGYMIEVQGYASAVGSAALNQKLSEDRADEVTNILVQQGHIPLTRMLAPGAMGETHQVGNDQTQQGQAENRRVVVRVLQNKGIAGIT